MMMKLKIILIINNNINNNNRMNMIYNLMMNKIIMN